MRTGYDAATPAEIAAIPADAAIVCYYDDGRFVWTPAELGRFGGAVKLAITVFASDDQGDVLDVETGDAIPSQAPGWAARRRAVGIDPGVYCNDSNWSAAKAAFAAQGVPEPHWWIAEWGPAPGQGSPHIPAGADACQYDHDLPYDISLFDDTWPPPPSPSNQQDPPVTYGDNVIQVPGHITLGPDGQGYMDLIPPDGKSRSDLVNVEIDWQNVPKAGWGDKVYASVAIGGSDDPTINAPGPAGRVRLVFENGQPNHFYTFRAWFAG
jgi:hypothetical protein